MRMHVRERVRNFHSVRFSGSDAGVGSAGASGVNVSGKCTDDRIPGSAARRTYRADGGARLE